MTIKRAAIYIRTSSERQAQRVSPQAQEADCRAYCEERGYKVVAIYRDVEKYRAGTRLVEPSGTRSDRPQLKQMLADAAAKLFDVIIAWREDRLYRGVRPMIDVVDCIEQNNLDIELVKETFDRRMAPIKASIAKMELDAKHDRFMMGVAGRLAKGKSWNGFIPYGYTRHDGIYELHPEESHWIRQIFEWYAEGVTVIDIHRRLIAAGVPERNPNKKHKWSSHWIVKLLASEYYWTGIQVHVWDGQRYELPLPIIIDPTLAKITKERRLKSKTHPARNLKHEYLGMGLVYCAICGWKMGVRYSDKNDDGSPRKTPMMHYYCTCYRCGQHKPDCVRYAKVSIVDTLLWEKAWAMVSNDELFENAVQEQIETLKHEETDAAAAMERLQHALQDLADERQKVITWARKGTISEGDLDNQLAALNIQEADLRHEISRKSLLVGNRAQKLIDFADRYRKELRAGAEWLPSEPQTPEDARKLFRYRREIVEATVKRVDVFPDKTIKVHFELDLLEAVENRTNTTGCVVP